MINDAKPRLIITNSNDTKIKQIIGENQNVKLFNLNDILINDNGSDIIIPNTNSKKNVACVLYTSGSTGLPKGVLLSNESIMNRLFWQWDEFRLDETDIGAFKTSMNFVDHIAEIFAFILKGLPIVVIDPEITSSSINALIDTLYDYKVTYFVLVPSLLRNILIYTKATKNYFKLNHIKRYVCSGEKLTRDLLDLFFEVTSDLKIKPVVSNFYGSTEVTADITFITFKSKEQVEKLVLSKSDVPIGVPISNSRVYLFDENMQIIDTEDKIGEIYAGGKCLANGYLKNENETNKFVTINNEYLFKTGDFGYFHDSLLYYSGRADSQIKINGKRVDLAELEFHSTKIKEIKSLVPLVYNDFPIAFYESDSDLSTEILNEIIIGHLKDCVYEHMIPNIHNLIRIESIPLLYNGKIDKQKLKGIYEDKNQALQHRDTKIESKNFAKKVLDIIQKITGIIVKNSSSDLSFDKLGINSLNYVEIYFELNEILHKKISFDQFLSIKSVNELLDQSAEKNLGKSIYRIIKFSENESLAFEVLNMFVGTFNDRNIIHSTFPIESTEKNLYDCFHPMVEYLKSSDKCFVVFDVTKQKYVGGCFIYDYDDNPPFTIVNEFFFHLLELLDLVAKMAADKEKLRNKKILYSAIVTTSPETSQEENVMIINFIEENIINIGREFDFDAILTTNTSKLTQRIST
ncbi:unnamed protein product [Brachionus calyciflorus]|uniref:Carrier domain-containing protein n=1 Tax=Brachionus calyciflorus TaxID=104777 RepID=A0A813XHM2_9BILA|nr:unnamed protein product [Brachionus calyciflorus]